MKSKTTLRRRLDVADAAVSVLRTALEKDAAPAEQIRLATQALDAITAAAQTAADVRESARQTMEAI